MYRNIGAKIRGLARTLFIICIVVGAINGACMGFIITQNILWGLLCFPILAIIGGVICGLLGWIASWPLYGFGILVGEVESMGDHVRRMEISNRDVKSIFHDQE